MADIKLQDIPTITSIAAGDKIPFTSAPGGTPVSKNITLQNLLKYGKRFVFEGDSITVAYPSLEDWMDQLIILDPWVAAGECINVAEGSDTAEHMSDVAVYANQIRPYKPILSNEHVFLLIMAGVNDFGINDRTPAQVYDYLKTIWAYARADGFKIVAFTVTHSTVVQREAGCLGLIPLVLSDPTLYDYLVRTDLLLPDASDTDLYADGIHPTLLGYKVLARGVSNVLHGQFSNHELANWAPQGPGLMVIDGDTILADNVGINTWEPGAILPPGMTADPVPTIVEMRSKSDTSDVGLLLRRSENGDGFAIWQQGGTPFYTYLDSQWDNAGSKIILRTRTDGTPIEVITILGSGNVGVGVSPATKFDVGGSFQISSVVNLSLGGYVRTFAEATGTPSGATTYFDIAVNVPSGAKLLGCQLRVDTALTAGETWGAAYVTGSTTVLAAAGQAVAKNTKVNKMHIDEITIDVAKVRITRDAGNFTDAVGVIRAIVYYETFTAMGDTV